MTAFAPSNRTCSTLAKTKAPRNACQAARVKASLAGLINTVERIGAPSGAIREGRWVLWINPMTPWITAYQNVLLQGAWPNMASWLGALAWTAGGALLLNLLLQRSRDQLVDWL